MMYHHEAQIKDEFKKLEKLEKIRFGECRKMKDYMKEKSLEDARTEFL